MSSNTSKKILLLAANSKGTTPLLLNEEVRKIDAGLQRSKHCEQFVLEQKWAVRPRDIQRAMLDINPQIVHFSGHGQGQPISQVKQTSQQDTTYQSATDGSRALKIVSEQSASVPEGLVLEDDQGQAKLVDGEALAGLFELFAERVECVVLNGCYSEVQASEIATHVNYVIGMNKAIGDRAAIEFAVGFYDALGAGQPIEFAYKFGCAAIRLAGIPEQLTPVLKKKPGIDAPIVKISLPSDQSASTKEAVSWASNAPIEVFFSYAHQDEQLRDELAKHLSILQRQGIITAWYDREISAGTEWAGQINEHLNIAQIILLLISADFLASDYCYDIELTRAMERHVAQEARVIPVILREVDWKNAPFGKLQALPKNALPVNNWANRDRAFADIARGICKAVEELKKKVNDSLFAGTIPITKEQKNNMAEHIIHMGSGNSNERIQANYYDTGKKISQNRSVSIGGNAIGSAIQTGDSNTASVQFKQTTLPAPESVNIRAEIEALRSALAKLESSDRRKIDNAFADAEEELKKPEPDKDEVGQALDRALNYGKKNEEFVQLIEKLEPHLTKVIAWLGDNWHKILSIVGLTT